MQALATTYTRTQQQLNELEGSTNSASAEGDVRRHTSTWIAAADRKNRKVKKGKVITDDDVTS
jgi:hypothetical protein